MSHLTPGRRIPIEILRLITHVTSPLGDTAVTLQRQAETATVVRSSATMLDVTVQSDSPLVDVPDGPIPGLALIYERERLVGELLVWVREGRLIGLEQAWYTDEPPQSWPSTEEVRVV